MYDRIHFEFLESTWVFREGKEMVGEHLEESNRKKLDSVIHMFVLRIEDVGVVRADVSRLHSSGLELGKNEQTKLDESLVEDWFLLLSIGGIIEISWSMVQSEPLTSHFIGTRGCVFNKGLYAVFHAILSVMGTTVDFTWGSDFIYLGIVSEKDELPSSVELDFRARLDGGRMYSGHLEAMRFP
ncbi:hypothetical protein Tco_0998026 [Tanacetum coccineum]